MKRYLVPAFCSVWMLAAFSNTAHAQAPAGSAEQHVAAARAAALVAKTSAYRPWQDFDYVISQQCTEPKPTSSAAAAAALRNAASTDPRPRADWFVEPAKVFDNLYYLGTNVDDIWAITTSEGIILVDANFNWNVEELVVGGMKKLGLDAANIKYLVITHAHSDHYFGAKFIQDRFHPRVLMSEADWNVIAKDNAPASIKPRKDMVVTDGQKLTLGDTTITLYSTPGHTPGTISMLIPLKDGSERHVGGMFGGFTLGIARNGVQYFPDWQTGLKTYLASVKHFQDVEAQNGVDTLISIHSRIDKTMAKIDALKMRKPGEAHPFVSKDLAQRFLTTLSECLQAQLAWRAKSSN